jgi:hypothetical protein
VPLEMTSVYQSDRSKNTRIDLIPVAVTIDRFIVDVTRKGRLKRRLTRNGTRLFIGYNKRALWVFEKVDIPGNFD